MSTTNPPAWIVEVDTYACVTFAETRAKAKWNAVSAYWEAGFGRGPGNWPPGVSAHREPRYDKAKIDRPGHRTFIQDYVEDML